MQLVKITFKRLNYIFKTLKRLADWFFISATSIVFVPEIENFAPKHFLHLKKFLWATFISIFNLSSITNIIYHNNNESLSPKH